MNKRDIMNEAIVQHGFKLLDAFPLALGHAIPTTPDHHGEPAHPVQLCKALRRVETKAHRLAECMCNEPHLDQDAADRTLDRCLVRAQELLGLSAGQAAACGLFINRDPRGYALKLGDDWTKKYNATADRERRIPQDWGGYGLLAPDLTDGAYA
jgi:hypothetical protein